MHDLQKQTHVIFIVIIHNLHVSTRANPGDGRLEYAITSANRDRAIRVRHKCVIFEEIDGIATCAKEHRPGVACAGFNNKAELLTVH